MKRKYGKYMTARLKNKNKNSDRRKGGLWKPRWRGGTDTSMNCGETKEKAKAALPLLGSPQCLSTCCNARVLLNGDDYCLVEYRHRLDSPLRDLLCRTAVFAFILLLPHLTVSLAA